MVAWVRRIMERVGTCLEPDFGLAYIQQDGRGGKGGVYPGSEGSIDKINAMQTGRQAD